MRTTIESSNDRRSSLHSLAAQRGLRGYSKLIEETVDLYIREKTIGKSKIEHLLRMRRTWNKEDARNFQKKLREIRRNRKTL